MQDLLSRVENEGIIAVIRAEDGQTANEIAKRCYEGGISILEITFTVPNAAEVIAMLVKGFGDTDMVIGAGTVLDPMTAKIAVDAGAKFIVSPGFDLATAQVCQDLQVPYFPGCLTLTEMLNAINAGAKIIKLFPGSAFGPDYVKAIKGPLPNIKIMPTGGVTLDNVKDWFKAGVIAVGVGGDLCAPAKTGDFAAITERAKQYVAAIASARVPNKKGE
ncbi:MAG: bifunctional 2-keto-4-hydroxyglutarate aldolase/2-keto-3-deoxy-6-phosphogluconate aldolase [Bacilli bacterium]|nr:bifunctional 2-keto-4-hydroxyglutarate aldolase/2-keto-3-deoxy-6-phosphogluconate aldolase [Bacilli bacterium]